MIPVVEESQGSFPLLGHLRLLSWLLHVPCPTTTVQPPHLSPRNQCSWAELDSSRRSGRGEFRLVSVSIVAHLVIIFLLSLVAQKPTPISSGGRTTDHLFPSPQNQTPAPDPDSSRAGHLPSVSPSGLWSRAELSSSASDFQQPL